MLLGGVVLARHSKHSKDGFLGGAKETGPRPPAPPRASRCALLSPPTAVDMGLHKPLGTPRLETILAFLPHQRSTRLARGGSGEEAESLILKRITL